jgi:hypothetical protein
MRSSQKMASQMTPWKRNIIFFIATGTLQKCMYCTMGSNPCWGFGSICTIFSASNKISKIRESKNLSFTATDALLYGL